MTERLQFQLIMTKMIFDDDDDDNNISEAISVFTVHPTLYCQGGAILLK